MSIVTVAVLLLTVGITYGCTTLIAGRLATTDGSTLCTHSDDGETDPRLAYVPAKDHPPGSVRNVYYDNEEYPRYIGTCCCGFCAFSAFSCRRHLPSSTLIKSTSQDRCKSHNLSFLPLYRLRPWPRVLPHQGSDSYTSHGHDSSGAVSPIDRTCDACAQDKVDLSSRLPFHTLTYFYEHVMFKSTIRCRTRMAILRRHMAS